ncbi:LysR substrate-binding domain-containing protein [Paraburkholderia sp. CNPSo 3274]|nr:LysR substrate-binding domain-containing protein [Paraburkholderia sp. CNPSo 3274]MCP3706200.1 LysR substrate-binding domain-containing protein [Paraburkholderia sp. CNPSo 3274]
MKIHTDSNAELPRAVKAGDLDLMVGRMAEPAIMQGVSFEYLHTESLLVVVRAGHPLANGSGAPANALRQRSARLRILIRYPNQYVSPAGN